VLVRRQLASLACIKHHSAVQPSRSRTMFATATLTTCCARRICEMIPESALDEKVLMPLLTAMVESLNSEPRVAANICWVWAAYEFLLLSDVNVAVVRIFRHIWRMPIVQVKSGKDPICWCRQGWFFSKRSSENSFELVVDLTAFRVLLLARNSTTELVFGIWRGRIAFWIAYRAQLLS